MADQTTLTESADMYLVSMARIQEAGCAGAIPLSELAARLSILPVSANQMIRKLQEAGLVDYTPYTGVDFTPEGRRRALQVLRHHRLWEVFLVECLKMSPEESDPLADRMEHVMPAGAAERLAVFLGAPISSPNGHPIPQPAADQSPPSSRPLRQLLPGQGGRVAAISAGPEARAFLASQGLAPGAQVNVLASGQSGDMLLQVEGGSTIHMASSLVEAIDIFNL